MKNKRNSREETAETLAFYVTLASAILFLTSILFYNLSNFVNPVPSLILSAVGGYFIGLAFSRVRSRQNEIEIKNKLTQAYDDILDKSFLNPGNKMKKGVREDGRKK